ncbi:chromate transporter [Pectinatus sottacetonis]|uniref:chromate transporter n=1 Tax=Pectinatus sottacetonis TaxID=1002795 RepID=UPI0018C4B3C3|nr:chromate transporter [Pectinatus sottacetonis]
MIYLELFTEFVKVGLFCVGGGYASMPLIQAQVVDIHHWLSMSEFVNIFTISQMTPGPIGINASTFAGMKIAGISGAIAATAGFVTPSLIIGIILARLFLKYGDIGIVKGALNGLRPAVIALICAAGISFIVLALWNTEGIPNKLLAFDFSGLIILTISIIAVKKNIGVILVLIGSGILGLFMGIGETMFFH